MLRVFPPFCRRRCPPRPPSRSVAVRGGVQLGVVSTSSMSPRALFRFPALFPAPAAGREGPRAGGGPGGRDSEVSAETPTAKRLHSRLAESTAPFPPPFPPNLHSRRPHPPVCCSPYGPYGTVCTGIEYHGSRIGIGIEYRGLSGIGRIGPPSPSWEPPGPPGGGRDARSGRRGSHRL